MMSAMFKREARMLITRDMAIRRALRGASAMPRRRAHRKMSVRA